MFQRVEALSYTHHMDAALRALVDANEYAGDALLAQLVRVQQLVQQMAEVVPYDEPQSSRGSVAPLTMHLRSLERSLQEFQNSLPPSLQNHGTSPTSYRAGGQTIEANYETRLSPHALTQFTDFPFRGRPL